MCHTRILKAIKMGHQILGVIASIFIIQINVANSQSIPSIDWQFDPFSTDQWFKQKLDHYDSGNIQHWPQVRTSVI